ncbi:MAG: heterodisulfide reductase-related iron-sulfur binding cluster, partial [Candidatus Bathyarchaeia archaeon]
MAYFVGCSTNYNYTAIGLQAASILRRNGVHVVCPPQVCCGMPMLAEGNKKALIARVEENLGTLTKFIDEGYEIVTACPTCALMLKELIKNANFFGSEIAGKAESVTANTREFGEYLMGLHRRNLLNVDFQKIPRTVAYYPPCHLKIQAKGGAFFELMKLIPELCIVDIRGDYCCGMGGTLGL